MELRVLDPLKKLILSTGDTSDVDGFFALAEYSKVIYLPLQTYTCEATQQVLSAS